jgi:hypothetical protein
MAEPMSDKHFENKFEFPLWILIKQYAEEKDVSYREAALAVTPKYVKTIRYGDIDFENGVISKFEEEEKAANERWEKLIQSDRRGE